MEGSRGAASGPILRTEGLTMRFGGLTAVNNVSVSVERGEIRAIIGPNGAGKSTLFNCITGVLRPTSGRIFLNDENIAGLMPDEASHRGLARSYQITNILPGATVLENVRVAAQSRRHAWNMLRDRRSFPDLIDKARAVLQAVGLTEQEDELAANLSHGAQRNLEIGIALADHRHRGARHGGGDGARQDHHRAALRRGAGRGHTSPDPGQRPRAGGVPQGLMLTLTDVHTYYGKSHILHGVSLEVRAGEVVGLLGRNGVGKSTTLKTVMGLVRPSEGRVTFEGREIGGMASHRVAHLGIAWVPEDRRIFRLLTVMENLRTGLDRPGVTEARRAELLDKVYASFPVLAERRNQAGGTLSGGEQQMLAIARAMMLEPKIILLDEPTEGLMPRMVGQISEIISVLHRDRVAILLVEQNVPLTLEASDRVYIMEKGVVRHHAPAADLRANHAVIHQYLGV